VTSPEVMMQILGQKKGKFKETIANERLKNPWHAGQ